MAWGIAIAAASTALSAYGAKKSAKAQERASLYAAALAEEKAKEAERRASINYDMMWRQAQNVVATRQLQTVGQGFAYSGASAKDMPMSTLEAANIAIERQRMQDRYDIDMIRKGAQIDRLNAVGYKKAGNLAAMTTLLSGAGNIGVSMYGRRWGSDEP